MKLGLLTACLPGESLDDIAEWAGSHGYARLEVAAWPDRPGRDWEASHLDVESFGTADAERVRSLLDRHGLALSAVAYYENNLHDGPRRQREETTSTCAVASTLRSCSGSVSSAPSSVATSRKTVTENLRLAEQVLPPLVEYAGARDVRLVVENCPMEGWHPDGYPANLAYSPELWGWLADLGLCLNYDPSHLVWLGIDPVAALEQHADRVLHVQAKDVEVDAPARNRYGVFGQVIDKPSPGSAAGGATGSPASARSTGAGSSTRSLRRATTASSRSSTRTRSGAATPSGSSRASSIAQRTLAPYLNA